MCIVSYKEVNCIVSACLLIGLSSKGRLKVKFKYTLAARRGGISLFRRKLLLPITIYNLVFKNIKLRFSPLEIDLFSAFN
jgi:hypothetical protein